MSARRGRAQASGSDRINAHAAGRFLRAIPCPDARLRRSEASGYHPAVAPLLLAAAGVVALVVGGLILRTFGPRYRVGRLLATTPRVSVGAALAIAASDRPRYVRIDGRIDAEDEFEDAAHRPLVFRRTRLEARSGRDWRVFEDQREAVPFAIDEGLDTIWIDHDALDAGLVVVPRESVGVAGDLADRAPPGMPAETPVRARIEQISSVEQAIVLGVPVLAAAVAGRPTARMTAGLGRPLVLTVLEPPEAMRILAGGRGDRARLAAVFLGAGVALLAAGLVWTGLAAFVPGLATLVPALDGLIPSALAASPEASVAAGGDPRSNGQGPGLVGTPGLAILGVVGIGVVAALVTIAYVWLTRPPTSRGSGRPPH